MEGVTVRPIDTEDLCATGSFWKSVDVMLGKLLAQVRGGSTSNLAKLLTCRLCPFPNLLFNESP